MCKRLCRPSAEKDTWGTCVTAGADHPPKRTRSLLQMHRCHEFVVNHVVWYVSGSCTWEEALRHSWDQGHVHRDNVRRLLELPNADAVP